MSSLRPAGGVVSRVRFPVHPTHGTPPSPQQPSGSSDGSSDVAIRPSCSFTTTEEERPEDKGSQPGGPGSDGGSRTDDVTGLPYEQPLLGSCDPAGDVPPAEQRGAAEHNNDSRTAKLQGVGSLKVTILQRNHSREVGQMEETGGGQTGGGQTGGGQTGGLHCHVCKLTCHSVQVFQGHMSGAEHLRKLRDVTQRIRMSRDGLDQRYSLNLHTSKHLRDFTGRGSDTPLWCDTCQAHFSGDVIVHRRTEQHKTRKRTSRPFCPVCTRHFRTPRKFVEHMKSPEHKQQMKQQEVQEEELITVDAVGCFQEREGEEEEEEEEGRKEEEMDVADEEEDVAPEVKECKKGGGGGGGGGGGAHTPTLRGETFVVPVCGFVCRLCNKFFYRETTARHTHCRTHTHLHNLQRHRALSRKRKKRKGDDQSALG